MPLWVAVCTFYGEVLCVVFVAYQGPKAVASRACSPYENVPPYPHRWPNMLLTAAVNDTRSAWHS